MSWGKKKYLRDLFAKLYKKIDFFFFGCKTEVSFLMLEQFVLKIWLSELGEKSCHLKTIMHLFKPQRLGVFKWWLLGEELMWRGLSQTKNSHLVKSQVAACI